MARKGRAEDIEIERARAQFMLGKSLNSIAQATQRRVQTLCRWAKAGEWEKRRDENRRKAEERQDLESEKLTSESLKLLAWQRNRIAAKMQGRKCPACSGSGIVNGAMCERCQGAKTLGAVIGADDNELSRELRAIAVDILKLTGGLAGPAVQVNVAGAGPMLVQIGGKLVKELTDAELAAELAECEEPKRIEVEVGEQSQRDQSGTSPARAGEAQP